MFREVTIPVKLFDMYDHSTNLEFDNQITTPIYYEYYGAWSYPLVYLDD